MTDEPTTADPEEIAVTPTPADPAAGPAGPAAGPGRSRWPWLAALLAVAAVATGALALVQWRDAGDLRDDRADHREVARVAAAFGQAYLTYDFDDVDASAEAVRALSTASFAAGFEETSAPGIQELFASNQTTTVASVEEVFVGEVGDGRARALVVVDVAASSTASGTQRLSGLSFVLDLVHEGGDWLVSAVAPAPRPDISDPLGAPTTTTAPPAPASP